MSKERELLKKLLDSITELDYRQGLDPLTCEIDELLDQPEQEQEPVAWCQMVKGEVQDLLTSFEMKDWIKDDSWTPLYTSPPKNRGRITDEEIYTHCCAMDNSYTCNFIDGVEWAEEQHGIGGGE